VDINVAPTKSNLIAAKSTLEFSRKGFELLDKKRNVLIREMMDMLERTKDLEQRMDTTFKEAYEALMLANLTMGVANVSDIARAVPEDNGLEILAKSVMGVEIPIVKYTGTPRTTPVYSFYQTNAALDVAFRKFNEVKKMVAELAEIETGIYRLAKEIKKTQKRANALENIQIPKYEKIVKIISDVLEEKDREDFFRLKVMKKKSAKKKRRPQ
jgi:H(+)-transporting ATP synthase, vacuolar type, subunit D